ncbi:CD3337/EF1877 family mobilome membrane protein [Thermoflavimicrobium dichotomicum]|uniref:TrbL/VirB6 plasmid conjugal transfer protein n=1 Tax=Thermoflavimicrobium dichotomicum TaxID=46223 RepID=A0A1I3LVS1_9BACL|nr:type IV secretion system protein [Thermoflavimicrobium dichotomicum]SFI88787.1 TrbL/VirB6 plasmid conjugal transfer protein [Thermoflavimicrobium dichotomicum]
MRRKKIWAILVAMFFFIFLFSRSVLAADPKTDNQGHNLLFDILTSFPEERIAEAKTHGYEVRFARYQPSRYALVNYAGEQNSWNLVNTAQNAGYGLMHEINNMLWQLLLTWNFNVIMLVENSFSLDLVDAFTVAVEGSIQQLTGFSNGSIGSKGLWGNFLIFVLMISGAWIAYKGIVQRNTTKAWQAMVVTFFILMASLAFFANSGGMMRYLNNISSGISQEIMGVGNNITLQKGKNPYDSEVASFVAADKLYDMLIYEPYLMLQYGKTSSDPSLTQERIQKILGHKVGSQERGQAVKEEAEANNPMVQPESTFQRLGFILLLMIMHIILGVVFIVIAGAMILYQILFVILALFAPFALLLALYPAWSNIAIDWVKKFVGYALVKIVIGLFLSLILAISQFLYMMAPPKNGYLLTILLQAVLVIGVLWKRNDLISVLRTVQQGDPNMQNLANTLQRYIDKATGNIAKLSRMQK